MEPEDPLIARVPEAEPMPRLRKTYLAALSALLFAVNQGMVAAYSAPATVDMQSPGSRLKDITQDEVTWIASLPTISATVGTVVSGFACHMLGRRAVIMYSSLLYLLGWLMIAYAPSIGWIYCGRLFNGFCLGLCFVAVAAYVVEISPAKIRGFLTAGLSFSHSLGIFIVMILGSYLRWSWLAISGGAVIVIATALMYFMPESPAWLAHELRTQEAIESIKFLLGNDIDAKKELQNKVDTISKELPKVCFRDIRNPTLYKPLVMTVCLAFCFHSSGALALTTYTVEIFQNTGSPLGAHTSSVVFAAVQVIMSVVSSLLMDKAGRRVLFITSGVSTGATLGGLGAFCYVKYSGHDMINFAWIPLTCLIANVAAYSIGLGCVPAVMVPEIVPVHFRSSVLTLFGISNGLFTFTVAKSFEFMVSHVGYHGLFWIYSGFSFLSAVYGWVCLPETKGRTIQDISNSFSSTERNDADAMVVQ